MRLSSNRRDNLLAPRNTGWDHSQVGRYPFYSFIEKIGVKARLSTRGNGLLIRWIWYFTRALTLQPFVIFSDGRILIRKRGKIIPARFTFYSSFLALGSPYNLRPQYRSVISLGREEKVLNPEKENWWRQKYTETGRENEANEMFAPSPTQVCVHVFHSPQSPWTWGSFRAFRPSSNRRGSAWATEKRTASGKFTIGGGKGTTLSIRHSFRNTMSNQ